VPVHLPAQTVITGVVDPVFVQDVQVIVRIALAQACALSAVRVIICIKVPVHLPAQTVIIEMLVLVLVQVVHGIVRPAPV